MNEIEKLEEQIKINNEKAKEQNKKLKEKIKKAKQNEALKNYEKLQIEFNQSNDKIDEQNKIIDDINNLLFYVYEKLEAINFTNGTNVLTNLLNEDNQMLKNSITHYLNNKKDDQ